MHGWKLLTIVGALGFVHCGGGDSGTAALADAGPDARDLGLATIQLGSQGIGIASTGSDGQLLATTTTDAEGNAEVAFEAGGAISVLRAQGIITFAGLSENPVLNLVTDWDGAEQAAPLQLRFSEVESASAYEFFSCSSRDFVFDPGLASLALSAECAARSETSILGIAHDFGSGVYAYALQTLGPKELGDDVELVWQTDFIEHPIVLDVPETATSVQTSAFVELDGRLVSPMFEATEIDALVVKTPPFVESLDRIRVETLLGQARSTYLGPVPSEAVPWLVPVNGLDVVHVANEPPRISWDSGSGGDFLHLSYSVFADNGGLRWEVITPSDAEEIVFPQLPSSLPGVTDLIGDLQFGFATASRFEFGDADGFEDALEKGVAVRAIIESEMNRYLFENSVAALSTTTFWIAPDEK